MNESRHVMYQFLEKGGYVEMAKAYRQFLCETSQSAVEGAQQHGPRTGDQHGLVGNRGRIACRRVEAVVRDGLGKPGALLAQRGRRHKCSKPSYQSAFWTIVLSINLPRRTCC